MAPPFTALEPLKGSVAGTRLELAAQDLYPGAEGAFTGEISAPMLVDVGCRYAIVGHSERRHLLGEGNEVVAEKFRAAIDGGLRPILCVGETVEDREGGRTFEVLAEQLGIPLERADSDRAAELVVAYEPVWAIGTGRTATPELAQEAHRFIRECLEKRFGGTADQIRIQYGGSVKPDNVYGLMDQPDIDGALVGGASLDPESFYAIIRFDRPPEEKGK